MKRNHLLTLAFAVLVTALLAGCAAQAPTATVAPTSTLLPPTSTPLPPTDTPVPPTPVPAAPVLEVIGLDGTRSFTMDELMALPVTEGQGGIKSSTGKIQQVVFQILSFQLSKGLGSLNRKESGQKTGCDCQRDQSAQATVPPLLPRRPLASPSRLPLALCLLASLQKTEHPRIHIPRIHLQPGIVQLAILIEEHFGAGGIRVHEVAPLLGLEHLTPATWRQALAEADLPLSDWLGERGEQAPLPWDFMEHDLHPRRGRR